MKEVPVTPVPSQTVSAVLGGQAVAIELRQRRTGMYASVISNGDTVIDNVICRDGVDLVTQEYPGFAGNLGFVDLQGKSDPEYMGLGTRYLLLYKEKGE